MANARCHCFNQAPAFSGIPLLYVVSIFWYTLYTSRPENCMSKE